MKKYFLSVLLIVGGMQAMEVDLEAAEGEGSELVWLNQDIASENEHSGYKTIAVTIKNQTVAAYLHLAEKYGDDALNHAVRNWFCQKPIKQLAKAAQQMKRISELCANNTFEKKNSMHFESFFEDSRWNDEAGYMRFELTFHESVSRKKVQEFLNQEFKEKDIQVDGLYSSGLSEAAKTYAEKRFERKWKNGYKTGILLGLFAGTVITWATTQVVEHWES